MEVSKDIYYIGVNDHNIDLFEGQYDVPHGMAYNSYVILDEKIAVLDTVDAHFTDEWLNNLEVVFFSLIDNIIEFLEFALVMYLCLDSENVTLHMSCPSFFPL